MPNGNTTTVRDILERPFDPSLIKTRPAAYGGSLSYVEGHEYIKRLNEAFDGNWSFEVVKHEIGEHEVIVVGKFVAENIVKMAFGGSDIKRKKETGEIICLADDLKAAATDALKKASSFLGVGLHLYSDGATENTNGKATATTGVTGNGTATPTNGNGNGNGHAQPNGDNNGDDKSRLSSKQLGLILALARERGIGRDRLNKMTEERFNRRLEFVTRTEASSIISELQAA